VNERLLRGNAKRCVNSERQVGASVESNGTEGRSLALGCRRGANCAPVHKHTGQGG